MGEAQFSRAEALLNHSLALASTVGDEWGAAKSRHWLAMLPLERRDDARALVEMTDVLEKFRRLGDLRQICMVLGNLGAAAESVGDLPLARSVLGKSLQLARRLRYRWWIVWTLEHLARVAADMGEMERAARLLGATAALLQGTGAAMRSGPQMHTARVLVQVRSAIPDLIDGELAIGAVMSLDEVITEALAIGSSDSDPTEA